MKKPDVKGNRIRIKTLNLLKELVENSDLEYDSKTIRNVINSFNKEVKKNIMENPDGVELPGKIGSIKGVSCVTKTRPIDMNRSIQAGKVIYFSNLDTGGYLGKVYCIPNSRNYSFPNRSLWGFKPNKSFCVEFSKHYKQNWNEYDIIKYNIKGKLHRPLLEGEKNIDLETYNELEI